jgi:hypothetical protein
MTTDKSRAALFSDRPGVHPNRPSTPIQQRGGAPPVYRPEQALSQLARRQPDGSNVRPAAPPVYRPQAPVSQLKPAVPLRPAAPPVYRPQPLAVQGKMPPVARYPQQPAVLQRFRNGGTIQRVKIWYTQTTIDLIVAEKEASKKKFRTIMEDLHAGNFRAFTAVGTLNDAQEPKYWFADIVGSGGGRRGNYRLHINRKDDGFEVHLYEHSGGGRKGGGHVLADGGGALSEADSTVLADRVWTPPPVIATPAPVPTARATPVKKTPAAGRKKQIGDDWTPPVDAFGL